VIKTIIEAAGAIISDLVYQAVRAGSCGWKDQVIKDLIEERDRLLSEVRELRSR
jgi:hypothetical protein